MRPPRTHTLIDKHGVAHEMTTKQAAEKSGLRLGLIQKRLSRLGIRSLEKLFQSPVAAHKENMQKQKAVIAAHFGAERGIYQEKAKHEAVVLAGNQDVA